METKEDKSFGIIPVFKDTSGNFVFCLVQHDEGHWAFPKGHQDKNESEKETALRELKEETGIMYANLENNQSFKEQYFFRKDNFKYKKSVTYFLGFISSTLNTTPDNFKKEISELRWVTYKEAKKLLTFTEAKIILDQVFKYLKKV